jgi:hypothetical protein
MRNAECGTRNAECGMRNAECGMRNAECGMRNAERGMRNSISVAGLATRCASPSVSEGDTLNPSGMATTHPSMPTSDLIDYSPGLIELSVSPSLTLRLAHRVAKSAILIEFRIPHSAFRIRITVRTHSPPAHHFQIQS